jgi:gamma-glutamylputrescine oxidase
MCHVSPQDQVFWYLPRYPCQQLRDTIKVDVAVVGGGMAGLSAAQSFSNKGLSVALLEKNYCGAGASGKSSGFITPDSELALGDLMRLYGEKAAGKLWDFALGGVALIRNNIHDFSLVCDYQEQDTMVVATNKRGFDAHIAKEHRARTRLSYENVLYDNQSLSKMLGSSLYYGGISYGGTFGINAFLYCQAMKEVLQKRGVQIYEDTPAIGLQTSGAQTPYGSVQADHVVLCIDRFVDQLGVLNGRVYHAQTFLLLSCPLSQEEIAHIFPHQRFMVWDTDLIYNYFRLQGDNRLMFGGGSLLSTYAGKEQHQNKRVIKKLASYFRHYFPEADLRFDYCWPGLIGISKDIMPIAGPDNTMPHIYYVSAAAGLPWAAALGQYSAQAIVEGRSDLDAYFSPYRAFAVGPLAQCILGTPLSFAIANFLRVRSL